jgi:hypothetical protein
MGGVEFLCEDGRFLFVGVGNPLQTECRVSQLVLTSSNRSFSVAKFATLSSCVLFSVHPGCLFCLPLVWTIWSVVALGFAVAVL